MKTTLRLLVTALLITLVTTLSNKVYAQPCSDAGIASISVDSICTGSNTDLLLTAYVGAIQWQSFNGAIWVNEIGAGSTTDNYQVSPATTTDYRAVVTDVGCSPDTSNQVTVNVGIAAPNTTGDTRCGYGSVTLTATGSGIKWFDAATGGTQLAIGPSLTTNVSATTTFYAASSLGGGPPSPLTTTFAGGNGFDGNMFDIVATNTVTIDSFAANFNPGSGTAEVWYRPGTHDGFTTSNVGWTLAGTSPYNSIGTGAPGTPTNVFVNVTIPAGQTYAFYVHGSGGITYTNGTNIGNIYIQDANIQILEGHGGAYFSLFNVPRVFNGTVFYSAGCESTRSPAVATVTTAPTFSLSATPPALCQGESSVISATSSNSNYNYTWSPSTGLSGTTGSSVTASPLAPITYTVVANDGTCGFIDSVFISVGPASVAGTAAISSDTICLGSNATLFLTGNTGNIQWQRFDGTNWVNETGTGNNTGIYQVSPPSFTQYRAQVTSGGCPTATTGSLSLEVIAVADPVTVNDTLCGPGIANLLSTGPGLMNWFTSPTGGVSIHTGNTYSPIVGATSTYYVEASAGATYNVGAPNLGIGTQFPLNGSDWGLQFDVTQQVTIEKVYLSPGATSGNVIINLRASLGGPILNTVTHPVSAFSGLQPVTLGFSVNPGTGYRLELDASSVPCYYNSFGANYPYTFPGSSITITGFVNPNYSTGTFYYFFYNWEITEGCKSNRVPVTAVFVAAAPVPVPTIMQNGTILTSSSPIGNQWYRNGSILPGATNQTYDLSISGSGSYTVRVTDPSTGCHSQSLPLVYTGLNDDLAAAGINVYPNPVSETLSITFNHPLPGQAQVRVFNMLGELVFEKPVVNQHENIEFTSLNSGVYHIEINLQSNVYHTRVVKP